MVSCKRFEAAGKRLTSLTLIMLFVLVLPFVCWGRLGDPAHPHVNAHFVFVEPPLIEGPTIEPLPQIHQQGKLVHIHYTAKPRLSAPNRSEQATPQLLLLFTISILLIEFIRHRFCTKTSFRRISVRLNDKRWLSTPPSPPPQKFALLIGA